MVLHVNLDTAYITIPETISFCSGHILLIDWTPPNSIKPKSKRNGPIHTECKTILNSVSLSTEAETSKTFNNWGRNYWNTTTLNLIGPETTRDTP